MILFIILKVVPETTIGNDWNKNNNLGNMFILTVSILPTRVKGKSELANSVVDSELAKIRAEIDVMQEEMKTKLESLQVQEVLKQCTVLRDSYEKKLTETKVEKFHKDIMDYKHGRVYTWMTSDGQTTRFRRQHRGPRDPGLPSSGGSGSDASSTYNQRLRFLRGPRERHHTRSVTRGDGPGGVGDDTAPAGGTTSQTAARR